MFGLGKKKKEAEAKANEEFWNDYLAIQDLPMDEEKMKKLNHIALYCKDDSLKSRVSHEMAHALYFGKGVAQNKERAKIYYRGSCAGKFGPALNEYGVVLLNEGDSSGVGYVAKSIAAGELAAGIKMREIFQLAAKADNREIVALAEREVGDVLDDCEEKIQSLSKNMGMAYLAMGIICMCGIGEFRGYRPGDEAIYLDKAAECGVSRASVYKAHPEWVN